MGWGSLSGFLAMGGYGMYVWPSFGATALCMVWEVLALRHRRAVAFKEIAQCRRAEGGPQ
jgi:heme exporter protein D